MRSPTTALGLVLALDPPPGKNDDEIVAEVDEILSKPAPENIFERWKKGDRFFQPDGYGIRPGQLVTPIFGPVQPGKTMFTHRVMEEARARGLKPTIMVHDEVHLVGDPKIFEEILQKASGGK